MQISAANLLLAGQQPRAADSGRRAGDGFASALGQALPQTARPAQFLPASFDAETKAAAAAPPAPGSAPRYGTSARPGSQLDIRV